MSNASFLCFDKSLPAQASGESNRVDGIFPGAEFTLRRCCSRRGNHESFSTASVAGLISHDGNIIWLDFVRECEQSIIIVFYTASLADCDLVSMGLVGERVSGFTNPNTGTAR